MLVANLLVAAALVAGTVAEAKGQYYAPKTYKDDIARTRKNGGHKGKHKGHAKHGRPSYFRKVNDDGTYNEKRPSLNKDFIDGTAKEATLEITSDGPLDGEFAQITVSWSGIPNPSDYDWLAFYSPSDSGIRDWLDWDWNWSGQGEGSATFNITNLRDDMEFRYIADDSSYILRATSNKLAWRPHTPLQGRLAVTGDPTEMWVSFNSDTDSLTPRVQYGERSGDLTLTATGVSHTYDASDMCNGPATTRGAIYYRDPGHFHDIRLTGLKPNTRYFYQYGQDADNFSEEFSFVTAPVVNASSGVTMAMYGDHGADNCFRSRGGCANAQGTTDSVLADVRNGNTSLVMHVGDLSYALGYGYLWDFYGLNIQRLATRAPYMASVGNHEYTYTGRGNGVNDPSGAKPPGWNPSWGNMGGNDSGGECGVPTMHRFKPSDGGNSIFWYSFNHGNVHVLQMSSEHDCTPGSVQYGWMERDLASVDRSVTPWVIVTAHRPMYSSERYPSDYATAVGLRNAFEELLHRFEVDLLLAGHYHAYERTCPVYDAKCCPEGQRCTTHIVAGMAGIGLDNAGWYDEEWSVFVNAEDYGYLRLESSADSLTVEFAGSGAASGRVIDSVTLRR